MLIRVRAQDPNRVGRFVFMMLDGVGVGALPDAAQYGDAGSNTLGNLASVVDLRLPFLRKMGLGNVVPLRGVPAASRPLAMVGRLAPHSAGKDTTVGHWEHMGLITPRPFPTYPSGFPEEVLGPFRQQIGRGVLGNRPASGTQIIDELGETHLSTGFPIVYTSADSVFQIAAHVEVVPLTQLYEWCETARRILTGPHAVARVIARPFTGGPGTFTRTKDRRDFSLAPPGPLYLDLLAEAGVPVLALGKINEIYLGRGVSDSRKVASNDDNLRALLGAVQNVEQGLIFTNLVDFDMAWGHRNDVEGFARGLAALDRALPTILGHLRPDDFLLLSADHGVDPTTVSTDHSREYVPLLLYPRPVGTRRACYEGDFADTGATIYAHLTGQTPSLAGRSVLEQGPARGWRQYLLLRADHATPSRVGSREAKEAASWLAGRFGPPPEVAEVLGSGLRSLLGEDLVEIHYHAVPHWISGAVPGHPSTLAIIERKDLRIVALRGRLHGYEGYDVGEQQLQVHSLACWGVKRLILTNACGAVGADVSAGQVVLITEIMDLQTAAIGSPPLKVRATDADLAQAIAECSGLRPPVRVGVYAAVPGPQYETDAEVEVLRALGATVVGMSTAAEARAAEDEGMELAVLAVVTNQGATSTTPCPPIVPATADGDAPDHARGDMHGLVLAAADLAAPRVLEVVDAILDAWRRRGRV